MTPALIRFMDACSHDCSNKLIQVIAYQQQYEIRLECRCGKIWPFKLFSELKTRQPEGYVERYFQDSDARERLFNFLNGVLVIDDERVAS